VRSGRLAEAISAAAAGAVLGGAVGSRVRGLGLPLAVGAGYLLSAVPLLIMFLLGMRYFIRGLTAGALKA